MMILKMDGNPRARKNVTKFFTVEYCVKIMDIDQKRPQNTKLMDTINRMNE